MVKKAILEKIRKDFAFVKQNPKILGILLYGSYANGKNTARSDIDICIVVPKSNTYEMYQYITHNLKAKIETYDIHFFEELPLYIQGPILENGIVVYSPDEPALYEYFYFTARKSWEDLKLSLKSI